ncbi:MAG: phenylalanine--tRNA ligase subunit beta [Microbacteriaceae bacterium]
MRVPISWLREFVDLAEGITPEQVHADLVRVGFEEEEIIGTGVSGPVVVGEVLEFVDEPQSNGKTIRWCQVRVAPAGQQAADGGEDVRGIVCGASNFDVGDKVVVSLPGAVLPGEFVISARKTYGHISDGMLASLSELGLGEDHDGIIVLQRFGLDPEHGADAKVLLGLNDAAVDVNVTPDRGYAMSIRGLAREFSHSTGAVYRDPAHRGVIPQGTGFEVVLDDLSPIRGKLGASVFATRVVRGINASKPTPPWMVMRLQLAGIRSISLAVDITNYVMLELGQPIHGYDLQKLQGGLTVRRAAEGETLKTLDGNIRTLHTEDLLICDARGPIGLAGVMGGFETELSLETADVLIEAANFDRISIARTARRHKLPSEASKRFERGVDPQVAEAAADRVAELLVLLAGGTLDTLGSFFDISEDLAKIVLPKSFASAYVGIDYTPEQIVQSLELIGAELVETEDTFVVTPPSWRSDLRHKTDLVEEIARIVGYDQIPAVLPIAPPGKGLTRAQKLRRQASNQLAAAGYTEVIVFPFLAPGLNTTFASAEERAEFGLDDADAQLAEVKLANPLDGEAPYLRRCLLPGLLQLAHRNHARGLVDLAVFESGLVFRPEADTVYGHEILPEGGVALNEEQYPLIQAAIVPQPRRLGVLLLGSAILAQPGQPAQLFGWQDAIDAARVSARALGVELLVKQGTHPAYHPGRTAELFVQSATGERSIGFAGELLPHLTAEFHLPRVVGYSELDLDLLIELAPPEVIAESISTQSAATQDLSLVVDAEQAAGAVLESVQEGAGALLEQIRLVADYRGEGVPAGKKSLTFALRFRADDRTLTAAEATEAKMAGVALAESRFGAQIRD